MNTPITHTRAAALQVREAAEAGGPRVITGYAIRFNEESVPLTYGGERIIEVISPSCVTPEVLRASDIKMTLFHNREKLLARSNHGEGSLRLTVDAEGVRFEFDCPDTELGRFCLTGVERGDLSGCSFTFVPKEYAYEERGAGQPARVTHTAFEWLGEMTIGSDPAYPTTSVDAREYAEELKQKREAATAPAPEDERARRERLAAVADAMLRMNP